jgi:hypothetical protein
MSRGEGRAALFPPLFVRGRLDRDYEAGSYLTDQQTRQYGMLLFLPPSLAGSKPAGQVVLAA